MSQVACHRIEEVHNPLIMCRLTKENVEFTKDFCGPLTLALSEVNKVEENHTNKSGAPLVVGYENLGPISFYDACKKFSRPKPKTGKNVILDILKKEDFCPSYFSILHPRSSKIHLQIRCPRKEIRNCNQVFESKVEVIDERLWSNSAR